MRSVTANIDFLADLPIYETEKPYYALMAPHEGFDPNAQRMDNLEYTTESVVITNLRETSNISFKLDECGFEFIDDTSAVLEQTAFAFEDRQQVAAYKGETEKMLRAKFDAEYVLCYDFRERRNTKLERDIIDYNDPLLIEGPARGAHSDITKLSGPQIIQRYMPIEQQKTYLKAGKYRVRIVNTWRPLIPNLEDRPLALCDRRTVDISDLVEADRILPDRVGEVYYLKHNTDQKWYFLDRQTTSELCIFKTYDMAAGDISRWCPHASFDNPAKSSDAFARRSVETRSIIITDLGHSTNILDTKEHMKQPQLALGIQGRNEE